MTLDAYIDHLTDQWYQRAVIGPTLPPAPMRPVALRSTWCSVGRIATYFRHHPGVAVHTAEASRWLKTPWHIVHAALREAAAQGVCELRDGAWVAVVRDEAAEAA